MFFSYLKRHYKIVILLAVFAVVFAAIFSLYDLETEAIVYSCVLCFFLGLIGFGFGYWRYCEKHKKLVELLQNSEMGLDQLPEPQGKIEEDYQRLASELYNKGVSNRIAAENSMHELEDYYTLWAHQIKTPISAMRLILEGNESREGKLLLAEIFKTEQYVEMAMQYMRLGSESSDLLLREFDLDTLIRACLRKYARLFSLKELSFSFEDTHLSVLSDEKWLAFVIEQLFSNSLKYTLQGKISIYAEGNALVIEDTGIGIRAEDLPRVCEKGYTGAVGREYRQSTGIGLFLCKSILAKLGHSFEISSLVGVGTKVKIGFSSISPDYE